MLLHTFTRKRLGEQCEQLVGNQASAARPKGHPANGTPSAASPARSAQDVSVAALEGGWLDDVQANGTLEQLGNVLQAIGEFLQ